MKKFLLTAGTTLGLLMALSGLSVADDGPNWWGDFYNKDTKITISITNFRENPAGFAYFLYTFSNESGQELCDGTAGLENIESTNGESGLYNFNISPDNNTVSITDTKGGAAEEDGCTKALYGTFVRK